MDSKDIIKKLIVGIVVRRFLSLVYFVAKGDTLVILSENRLDCKKLDKFLKQHGFRYKVWVSFSTDNNSIDELDRIKDKTFNVTEYIYNPTNIGESDINTIQKN